MRDFLSKRKTTVKVIFALLAFVVVVVSMPASVQAKSKGYKFTYKKVSVYMGGPAKKLIKKAGKPVSKKASKSCAYDGMDRVYQYEDFILYTYSNSNKGKEYVNGITFLTDKVKTKEGIQIGSSLEKVEKKYKNGTEEYGIYTYEKGDSCLQIEITDDVVTNIRYIKAE